ncbi:cupin domain-containing protein, partial [Halorubrum sp. CBA1125]|uniref:cupin domain-containing protein n=1 Tax=Halorubrum sp. CBA1125 TaxID=2668072 RepID=UPI0012E800DB
ELSAEVPAFDDDGYAVEQEGPSRFVAELPKVEDEPAAEIVRIAELDGVFLTQGVVGEATSIQRFEIEPGGTVPEHDHPGHVVLFHVLTGAIDVRLDGEPHPVEAGEVLRFDGDLSVEPTAREDSTALVVLAPGQTDGASDR